MSDRPKQYRSLNKIEIIRETPAGYDIKHIDEIGDIVAHSWIGKEELERDYEPVEQAAQEWRPIDDNTPRDGTALLSYWYKMPCFIAWIDNEGWRVLMNGRGGEFQIHGNYAPYEPTHFMTLPKPPASEDNTLDASESDIKKT